MAHFQKGFEDLRDLSQDIAKRVDKKQRGIQDFDETKKTQIGKALVWTLEHVPITLRILESRLGDTPVDGTDDDNIGAVLAAEAAALDPDSPQSVLAATQQEIMLKMNERFGVLVEVVQLKLGAASLLKSSAASIGDAAKGVEAGVNKFADSVKAHLADVRQQLANQRKCLSETQDLVRDCQESLSEMDEDLDDNKHLKRVANAGRVLSWGATLFVPGYAVVAGACEYGAYKLRQDRRRLKEAKDRLDTTVFRCREMTKTLESQVKELNAIEANTRSLASKSGEQSKLMREVVSQASKVEGSMHVLDSACSQLLSQVRRMGVESEGMVNLVMDSRLLRQAVATFIHWAMGSDQEYVRQICAPTARLLG